MRPYKRIERCVARYLAPRYQAPVEVGVGANFEVALSLSRQGIPITCTDIRPQTAPAAGIRFVQDDVLHPQEAIYRGADLIYAIRPGVEMIPPLIALAQTVSVDLLVYHLGNEVYLDGGVVIDCGVRLHRYHTASRIRPDPGPGSSRIRTA